MPLRRGQNLVCFLHRAVELKASLVDKFDPCKRNLGLRAGRAGASDRIDTDAPGRKAAKKVDPRAREILVLLYREQGRIVTNAPGQTAVKRSTPVDRPSASELGRFGREGRFANFAQTAGPFFAQDRIDTDAPGLKTVKRSTPLLRNRGCGRGGPASKIRPGSKILFGAKFFA